MAQIKNIKKPGDLIRGASVGLAGLDKDGAVIGYNGGFESQGMQLTIQPDGTVKPEFANDDKPHLKSVNISGLTWTNGYYMTSGNPSKLDICSYSSPIKLEPNKHYRIRTNLATAGCVFNNTTYIKNVIGWNSSVNIFTYVTFSTWDVANPYLVLNIITATPDDYELFEVVPAKSFLNGKKLAILGDSISYGVGITPESCRPYYAYWTYIAEWFNMPYNNYSVSGSTIAQIEGSSASFVDRYSAMAAADFVIVFGGTNDFWHDSTLLGDTSSIDPETFIGALNVLIPGLLAKYANNHVVFITPFNQYFNGSNSDTVMDTSGVNEYAFMDALIERCGHYGVQVYDMFHEGGIDPAHTADQRTKYTADGVHLNRTGHMYLALKLIPKIAEYFAEYPMLITDIV